MIETLIESKRHTFYRKIIALLQELNIPFLIGGAYALRQFTGIKRDTKDLDIFIRPSDYERLMVLMSKQGYRIEHTGHWLGKIWFDDDTFIDIIFSSGNGICVVTDEWFKNAVPSTVLDVPVLLTPAEEMIWSKAFIQERERFDGADILHLLLHRGPHLNWPRLMRMFNPHWQVLFSHLVSFNFAFPSETKKVPVWVMHELIERMRRDIDSRPYNAKVCRGALLSRAQYKPDTDSGVFQDGRIRPWGVLTKEQSET